MGQSRGRLLGDWAGRFSLGSCLRRFRSRVWARLLVSTVPLGPDLEVENIQLRAPVATEPMPSEPRLVAHVRLRSFNYRGEVKRRGRGHAICHSKSGSMLWKVKPALIGFSQRIIL
ncbi:hypothetical protein AAFF_G00206520 [Aldrovandia affinis]|uniref:Uncharacterized protein n=1 Tax=Aldrovandia affinis TaxID=143900 RepID=A0AAD7RHR8_9TELE|nr:hypothetical protein AAFF_G00206520 [Aldrovandia affinis]